MDRLSSLWRKLRSGDKVDIMNLDWLQRKIPQAFHAITVAGRNLTMGGNLAALRLAANPRLMVHYVSESLFLYRSMAAKRGLPQRNVARVLGNPGELDVRLGCLVGNDWPELSSYTTDLIALCSICRIVRPQVVFEIGTLRGYSAYHFALNTAGDAMVYTLDLPPGRASTALRTTIMDDAHARSSRESRRYCFRDTEVARKVRCLEGDSATFDFSPYRQGVDLFFIDGAHSYEYVCSDTQRALECTRPGGVIAWHDFGRMGVNGVTRRLLELYRGGHMIYSVPGGSLAFMLVPHARDRAGQELHDGI